MKITKTKESIPQELHICHHNWMTIFCSSFFLSKKTELRDPFHFQDLYAIASDSSMNRRCFNRLHSLFQFAIH